VSDWSQTIYLPAPQNDSDGEASTTDTDMICVPDILIPRQRSSAAQLSAKSISAMADAHHET
jgi:hypothetical protein